MSKNAKNEMDVERVKKLSALILDSLVALLKEYKDKGRSEEQLTRGELLAALALAAHVLNTMLYDGVPSFARHFIADMMCSLDAFLDQAVPQKGGENE